MGARSAEQSRTIVGSPSARAIQECDTRADRSCGNHKTANHLARLRRARSECRRCGSSCVSGSESRPPRMNASGLDSNCGIFLPRQWHGTVLRVFIAQMLNREHIFGLVVDDFRITMNENIGEASPVFVVMIDNEGDARVLGDVRHSLDLGAAFPLRFFIYHKIKVRAVEPETERNIVRLTGATGGGEMRDAGGFDKFSHRVPFQALCHVAAPSRVSAPSAARFI